MSPRFSLLKYVRLASFESFLTLLLNLAKIFCCHPLGAIQRAHPIPLLGIHFQGLATPSENLRFGRNSLAQEMQQKKWPPAYQAVFVRGWVLKLTRKTWKRRLLRGVKWKDWLLWRRAGWIVYTAAMAPLLPLSLQIQHSSLSSLISCSPATIPKRISSGRSAAESNDIIVAGSSGSA